MSAAGLAARRGFGAEFHRARGRAVRARHVRGDLSSGRHRDADRAGGLARTLARLQRRLRQSRRGVRGGHHGGAPALVRLAWRAFLVPAVVCVVTGVAYLPLIPDDRHEAASAPHAPMSCCAPWVAATVFGLFILIALTRRSRVPHRDRSRCRSSWTSASAGILAGRGRRHRHADLPLRRASRSLRSGAWSSRFPLHLLFAAVALLQFVGLVVDGLCGRHRRC